jgi:hypothetical protein
MLPDNPMAFVFSLKNRIASMIEKIVSPFAKREVSDAVVCLRPTKNMALGTAAPIIEVAINRR